MNHTHLRDWIYLLLLSVIWGTSFILIKEGEVGLAPEQAAALRISISGIVLLPFAVYNLRHISFARARHMIGTSIFGNLIPAFLFSFSEKHIDSGVAGILNTLSPLWVFMLGAIFFQAHYNRIKILGVAVAFSGSTLIILYNNTHVESDWHYALLIVLATISYGISANFIKRFLQHETPLTAISVGLSFTGVLSAVYLFTSTGFVQTLHTNDEALRSVGAIAILSLFSTVIASLLYNRLIQSTTALFAASVTYVMPIVALLWGLLAGEAILLVHFIGMALIICGVYLVGR